MVGFPGETETEFQETYDFIANQPFTYLHLFPFSARPGTAAWELHRQDAVSGVAVRERIAALRRLIDEKNMAFRSTVIGRELSAVTLISPPPSGPSTALTDNFLPVELDGAFPANSLVTVRVSATTAHGLSGICIA